MPIRVPLLTFLLLLTPLVYAADVSGKWTGTLEFRAEDGHAQSVAAYADLKQRGNSLSGKLWKEADQQFVIEQGQVEGSEISFVFNAPEGEDEQTLIHSVKLALVSPTQMQGTLEFDAGGQRMSGKLTFSREK
jgi:hypothetical protein